jgi:hypothetical protein
VGVGQRRQFRSSPSSDFKVAGVKISGFTFAKRKPQTGFDGLVRFFIFLERNPTKEKTMSIEGETILFGISNGDSINIRIKVEVAELYEDGYKQGFPRPGALYHGYRWAWRSLRQCDNFR